MSLVKSLSTPNVREAAVELDTEAGKIPVTVQYKSLSVKDVRARHGIFKAREAAGETVYISEVLENRVVAFVEESGARTEVTLELLENMSIDNLTAIQKAIDETTDPK